MTDLSNPRFLRRCTIDRLLYIRERLGLPYESDRFDKRGLIRQISGHAQTVTIFGHENVCVSKDAETQRWHIEVDEEEDGRFPFLSIPWSAAFDPEYLRSKGSPADYAAALEACLQLEPLSTGNIAAFWDSQNPRLTGKWHRFPLTPLGLWDFDEHEEEGEEGEEEEPEEYERARRELDDALQDDEGLEEEELPPARGGRRTSSLARKIKL